MESKPAPVAKALSPLNGLTEIIRETVVISCSCCPSATDTEQFMSRIDLNANNFVPVYVTGITDTFLSKGARTARPGLTLTISNLIRRHKPRRLVVIAFESCKKDVVYTGIHKIDPERRIDEVRLAGNQLRGWIPNAPEQLEVELYLFKQSGKLYRVKRLFLTEAKTSAASR